MADLAIAREILNQMGGTKRLALMVGGNNFAGGHDHVQFKFKGSRKFNTCHIKLDASDAYTFSLYQYRPKKMEMVKKYELSGVYNDMLIELFESETGLYLSL